MFREQTMCHVKLLQHASIGKDALPLHGTGLCGLAVSHSLAWRAGMGFAAQTQPKRKVRNAAGERRAGG